MTRIIARTIAAFTVAGLLLLAASADAQTSRRRRWVPEFDPATAGAIATLLVGGGVLIARRRR